MISRDIKSRREKAIEEVRSRRKSIFYGCVQEQVSTSVFKEEVS